jgi:hypothetical protein
MSLVKFPSVRNLKTALNGPVFQDDIEIADSNVLAAMRAIMNQNASGLAILSGFVYAGAAYTGGIVYLNGNIYFCTAGLAEGQYLQGGTNQVYNKVFSDANSYPTYTEYEAIASNTQWGGLPVFSGNMNAYRIDLKTLKAEIALRLIASVDTWHTVGIVDTTLINGWAQSGSPLQFKLDSDGRLVFRGALDGTLATNQEAFILPAAYWPSKTVYKSIYVTSFGGVPYFYINTGGVVYFNITPAAGALYFLNEIIQL